MSIRGVWQLQKLTVQYCPVGGSSKGAREFFRKGLGDFASQYPHVECELLPKKGRHPQAIGSYIDGRNKYMALRNASHLETQRALESLVNSSSRKMTKITKPKKTIRETVQGEWTPGATEGVEYKLTHIA